MSTVKPAAVVLSLVLSASGVLAGCAGPETGASPPRQTTVGIPDRGKEAIAHYGCGTCHEIPGVRSANGLVGPPLDHFASRMYIAGELPNSADNLTHWIMAPQQVEPGTAMPNLDVSKRDAEDITAYLYTLK